MSFVRRLCVHLLWIVVPFASCKPTATVPGDGGNLPPPGRCFGKGVSCRSDGDCGGGFARCQEGTCCSGTLSAKDCTCECGGGPSCKGGELCCPGACDEAKDLGVLRCRPHRECFPCGPL